MGGVITQTPALYKGFTIGMLAKFLKCFIYDVVDGLDNYSLPSVRRSQGPKENEEN